MSLKKYDELTEEQKKLVALMYSDRDTLAQFLYNFDDKGKFTGRQYAPPVGVIHAESAEPEKKVEKAEIKIQIVEDDAKGGAEDSEKPKAKRTRKK